MPIVIKEKVQYMYKNMYITGLLAHQNIQFQAFISSNMCVLKLLYQRRKYKHQASSSV